MSYTTIRKSTYRFCVDNPEPEMRYRWNIRRLPDLGSAPTHYIPRTGATIDVIEEEQTDESEFYRLAGGAGYVLKSGIFPTAPNVRGYFKLESRSCEVVYAKEELTPEEQAILKERRLAALESEEDCCICFEKPVDLFFFECAHSTCDLCAAKIERCPLCRAPK